MVGQEGLVRPPADGLVAKGADVASQHDGGEGLAHLVRQLSPLAQELQPHGEELSFLLLQVHPESLVKVGLDVPGQAIASSRDGS